MQLRSFYLSIDRSDLSELLPINVQQKQSSLESLFVDHYCTIEHLISLLRCVPQLRSLQFFDHSNSTIDDALHLEDLTSLSLSFHCADYEIFSRRCIQQISSKLRKLFVDVVSDDIAYLDADR